MAKKQVSYRELNAELEQILADLQADGIEVDQAIKQYERGVEIVKQLETHLAEAENKITQVKNGR